jgi:hypothetical protein
MSFTLDHSVEILERTPATLRAQLGGLSEFWILNNYGEKTFSPFDVVGHLIHAERTNWMTRARAILDQKPAPFPPFDRYAMYETSRGKSIDDLLEEFETLRRKNLDDLRALSLTERELNLTGTHPDFGLVTLRQLLATWVVHDLNHLHQIAKSMAYQYRDAVGPWRQFLTILPQSQDRQSNKSP